MRRQHPLLLCEVFFHSWCSHCRRCNPGAGNLRVVIGDVCIRNRSCFDLYDDAKFEVGLLTKKITRYSARPNSSLQITITAAAAAAAHRLSADLGDGWPYPGLGITRRKRDLHANLKTGHTDEHQDSARFQTLTGLRN